MEIDDWGVFASVFADFFVGADGDDFSAVNGHSLGDGVVRVHGDDFAVDEDEVGGLGNGGCRGLGRASRAGCEERGKEQTSQERSERLENRSRWHRTESSEGGISPGTLRKSGKQRTHRKKNAKK